jgi:hypothetical protein
MRSFPTVEELIRVLKHKYRAVEIIYYNYVVYDLMIHICFSNTVLPTFLSHLFV